MIRPGLSGRLPASRPRPLLQGRPGIAPLLFRVRSAHARARDARATERGHAVSNT